jgi:hypothetical protein
MAHFDVVVCGPGPDAPNVIVASPGSGHGFKFAPVIGEILADPATTGATDHDIMRLPLAGSGHEIETVERAALLERRRRNLLSQIPAFTLARRALENASLQQRRKSKDHGELPCSG